MDGKDMNRQKTSLKKRIIKILGVVLSIIILWFLVKEFISNWEDIKPYLSQLKIGWLVFAVIVYALCFMGTGFNWAYMQWQMDKSIHWVEYLNIHMTSAFARYIPDVYKRQEQGCKLVHVSTDYVFEGNGTRPYVEFDMPNPQGVYGKTKLEGENFVRDFADKYFIIRTAWLYGEGKNFVRTMLRLSETNESVRVVRDQVGSPTSAMELARCIRYLLPSHNYGTFHGTCEGVCSWADFAEEIFRLAGKRTKVEKISTEEYGAKVKRPAYSVLDNYMLKLTGEFRFSSWQDALKEYMKDETK